MSYDGLKISKESVEKIFPRRDIGDIDLTVLDNITAKKNKGAYI
jgi:hypothetical protein